jgi:hypothetical protein
VTPPILRALSELHPYLALAIAPNPGTWAPQRQKASPCATTAPLGNPSILIIQFADLPHLTINNLPLLIKYETDSIFSISLLHHNLTSNNNQNTLTSTLEYQKPLGYPKLAKYQPKRQHKMCREAPCELCSTFLTLSPSHLGHQSKLTS